MKKFLFLLFLVSAFFSCNKSTSIDASTLSKENIKNSPPPPSNNDLSEEKLAVSDSTIATNKISLQGTDPGQNPDWDKKIIKTANLKIEVKDFKQFADYIQKSVKQYDGYIASEEQTQSDEKLESAISIKVPVEQFEPLLNQFSIGSEKIIEKKITTEDVTGEVVDTKSRLQAKEQMRLKYLEFLKEAKNMSDVLKVQDEINNIQEEIESASGRINYLSHQSAFSTINLTYYQPFAGYNPSNGNPGFLSRTSDAFKRGFSFISEIVIGLISIWPLLLLIMLIWIFWKRHSLKILMTEQKS